MKLRLPLALLFLAFAPVLRAQQPIRVAIVGLVHGHVKGFLRDLPKSTDAQLVAIVEPDTALAANYEKQFSLDHSLFHTDLEETLNSTHPDAVLVYTTILDHRRVIESAARHHISSMVEKPLATTMPDTLAIRDAAKRYNVHVLVNYETTWYSSNAEALSLAANGKLGDVRKVVVHDGHKGPKEIGVGPEWLPWLTDPVRNGAGALFDFGCYGADLTTVLMHGETPISVTASAQTDKPEIYPHVDDDATIIVRYPKTQAVLMASWNWSFDRKDMELYGTQGTIFTVGPSHARKRFLGESEEQTGTSPSLPADQSGSLKYLAAVLHGQVKDQGDLSSLDTNLIVMQILDAARTSVQTGKTVSLKPLR
ncbi:Gfo/Idh/MocA family protein [Terriglobus albidus]|uniref:Gfo/Idh/MocA family protein n=1 Tax=Terriglobus albidus TaxID=1592106 RepID=UPI001FEAFD24|nr:Gfo/Idh/MocA family oxidoreductase [Terriglobus albidus]